MEGGAQARHPGSAGDREVDRPQGSGGEHKRRRGRGGRKRHHARSGADEAHEEPRARTGAHDAERGLDDEPAVIWKGYRLNDFQRRAVAAIRAGHDVIVSAPTGAGKTLVAEYAIEEAERRGGRCIYTAPIKALSNQKYRDFKADDIDVGLMTGDVTIRPQARVLIMTTEILRNSIFEAPEHLSAVDFVVFDEVHYLDDPERGTVWEESLIFAPPSMRFVSLSATVSNLSELGAWLSEVRQREVVTISSERRPVPLEHLLVTEKSGVFPLDKLGQVRRREAGAPEQKGGRRPAGGRLGGKDSGRHRSLGRRARGDRFADTRAPDPARLLDRLERRGELPALVFAFSRRDVERLAYANAQRELLEPDEVERMRALQLELIEIFQLERAFLDSELLTLARRGISYHHAGLLPIHKELVERMFTSGMLKLLFTTETFALGINMPARSVIFYSLRKFDGVSFDYMRARDYMQMAGRAGRQGLDDAGLVYSLLSTRDLADAPLEHILAGRAEAVESRFRLSFSTLLHLFEHLGRERIPEAWERSFNRFQHRSEKPKVERKNRLEQRRLLELYIGFLESERYVDERLVLPRGRLARGINGFELEVTELCFRGTLEHLAPRQLAVVFVGLIYEERRRNPGGWVEKRLYGDVRGEVDATIGALAGRAIRAGVPSPIKRPDWTLTPALAAWLDGAVFEDVLELTEVTPGDLVRCLRMAIQLMRQTRRALDPAWDLCERLETAMALVDRDEVDARRQLELG